MQPRKMEGLPRIEEEPRGRIKYELEEIIRIWVEKLLTYFDERIQSLHKEFHFKMKEAMLDFETSLNKRT
jgi:hypothetical protein